MKKDVSIATHSAIIPLQSSCFMHGLLRGGTIIIKNNQPTKVQLSQLGSSKEGTYPHWHPSGKYIIFSTNTTRQSFYSRNPNLIEVYDLESDLVLYDLVHNTVITDPRFNGPASFETFPAWAPDGNAYITAQLLPDIAQEVERD